MLNYEVLLEDRSTMSIYDIKVCKKLEEAKMMLLKYGMDYRVAVIERDTYTGDGALILDNIDYWEAMENIYDN